MATQEKQDTMATVSAASHPFTCNACQVAFRNPDIQKGHMKTDWHRYNLMRKVTNLPPISADTYTDRVLKTREETSENAGRAAFQRACEACRKTFYSENSFQNHLGSARHKTNQRVLSRGGSRPQEDASTVVSSTFSLGEPAERRQSVDSDAEEEFSHVIQQLKRTELNNEDGAERPSPVKRPSNPHLSAAGQHKEPHPVSDTHSKRSSKSSTPVPTQTTADNREVTFKTCLFCSYDSPSLTLNVNHMQRIHGMFIPEQDYLVDLEGLIGYLQTVVYEKCRCLVCRKTKTDVFAIQMHMRDASHCKIPYDTEQEMLRIGDFYDFRSTYSDGDEDNSDDDVDMEDGHSPKLGVKRHVMIMPESGEYVVEEDEDEGWETDTNASSVASEEITSLPMDQHIHQYEKLNKHLHHSHSDPRKRLYSDGFHSHAHKHAHHAAFYDDYELHLPSGKSVGHRSLARYYRQYIRDPPSPPQEAALAIEGSPAENGEAAVSESRSIVRRGELGIIGLSDEKKKELRKIQRRDRKAEKRFKHQKNRRYTMKRSNIASKYNVRVM